MRPLLLYFGCALLGAPAAAQAPAVAETAAPVPVDAARLALARELVAQMVTDESIGRMFGGIDRMMSNQMIAAIVPAGDLAKVHASDPYFDERMRRVMRVTGDYLREVMQGLLPGIREAMAVSFARRLSTEDLTSDLAFARTPAGQRLFAGFYDVMQDPAYAEFMRGSMKRLFDGSAGLVEKIKAATADLPPPPKTAR